MNVLELKCLNGLMGVSCINEFRSEEVHRRAGIESEMASRVDKRVL